MTNTTPTLALCPAYDPLPGGTRCRHALPTGACSQPDELLCPSSPDDDARETGAPEAERDHLPSAPPPEADDEPAAPHTRLVEVFRRGEGPQAAEPAPSAAKPAPAPPTTAPLWWKLFGNAPPPSPKKKRSPPPPPAPPPPPLPEGPTPLASAEDVGALATQYPEVRLENDELGPLWLVAEPSGLDRLELTFRDAAALAAVCAAFPGARVTELRRAKKGT